VSETVMQPIMRLHRQRERENRNHTRTEIKDAKCSRQSERAKSLRHFNAAKRNSASARNLCVCHGKSRQREAKGESIRGSERARPYQVQVQVGAIGTSVSCSEWKEEIGPATEDPKERKESANVALITRQDRQTPSGGPARAFRNKGIMSFRKHTHSAVSRRLAPKRPNNAFTLSPLIPQRPYVQ